MSTVPNVPSPALPMLGRPPAKCRLYLISDTRNAPFLRPGEYAVIDLEDRDYRVGDLYLVGYLNRRGECVYAISQVAEAPYGTSEGERTGSWLLPMNRPKDRAEAIGPRAEIHLADGPTSREHVGQLIVGSVVGVYDGPEGKLVASDQRFIGR